MRRVFFLAQAELLHVVRDRATLAQVFVIPMVQILILANAATFEIRDTRMWVVDLDRTVVSRGLVNRFAASGHFDIAGTTPSLDAANDALLRGETTLALVIPRDFETDVVRTRHANVELVVNAEKGAAAGLVQAYAATILGAYSAELARLRPSDFGAAGPAAAPRIDIRHRSRYNPTLNYQHYMVPGLLVALVTMIGTLLTAQNIAREKELGTLEQLNVTPITRGQFIAGKLLPFWLVGLIELALGLTLGVVVFDVPVRGSVPLLFGVAALYLLVALGIGLWISTIVDTQQQAMFVAFFIINIYMLMSGLFTPIDSMAPWAQTFAELNPVRHFVAISRAILIKGAGLADIGRPLTFLAVFAAVVLTSAVLQYRKRAA
ncbi:MAG TPA: ABC transporter permease [Vicinamibacterales bacterium]|nr:ABC transporter permease [Vicinamibacterales bacterium]